jgi:hypothetical protein
MVNVSLAEFKITQEIDFSEYQWGIILIAYLRCEYTPTLGGGPIPSVEFWMV